eukprot:2282812-Alexandrium_andersonii.AAC.1
MRRNAHAGAVDHCSVSPSDAERLHFWGAEIRDKALLFAAQARQPTGLVGEETALDYNQKNLAPEQ